MIQFLELKVVLEDYESKLLSASPVIETAWRALILETQLYKRVCFAIQDFHKRPRRMIHHTSVVVVGKLDARLARTQSLFKAYFDTTMPINEEDIDLDFSLTDASTLTDVHMFCQMPKPLGNVCTTLNEDDPSISLDSSNEEDDTKKREFFPDAPPDWISRMLCHDLLRDCWFWQEEDHSLAGTIILSDLEDESTLDKSEPPRVVKQLGRSGSRGRGTSRRVDNSESRRK
eukprot:Nitzschia sp. Nitz4//scaffold45_size130396//80336//81025//NITZ4_003459-RA/size130396-processed-gene-0.222-mRNA-1//-1//CDS//3329552428//5971//frame0